MLRCGNEELSRQIERLQKDRFNMVEELVYQRWLQSCLRFEIQNKGTALHETSENSLKNDSLLNSDEKIKSPTSNPSSSYSISSNTSSSTESDQVESTVIGSSPSSQNGTSKSSSFMRKMKVFGRCKDDSSVALLAEKRRNSKSRTGLIRRFSMSMVPVKGESIVAGPMKKNKERDLTGSLEKPSCPRIRRVSFSDLVKTDNVPSSFERVVLDQSAGDLNSSQNLRTGFEGQKNSKEKPEASLVTGGDSSDTRLKILEGHNSKSEIAGSMQNKDGDCNNKVYLFVVFFFFLFIFHFSFFLLISLDYNNKSQNLKRKEKKKVIRVIIN